MELWLLRHCTSIGNENGTLQGQHPHDPGLSEKGLKQAERIAQFLKKKPIKEVWTSPLKRALQLATVISIEHEPGLVLVLAPELMEISHGQAEGLGLDELKKRFPGGWKKWERLVTREPLFPGGESILQAQNRILRALWFVTTTVTKFIINPIQENKKVVVVSHGTAIRLALSQILNIPIKDALSIPLDNGSISILGIAEDGETLFAKEINKTDHLGDLKFTPREDKFMP